SRDLVACDREIAADVQRRSAAVIKHMQRTHVLSVVRTNAAHAESTLPLECAILPQTLVWRGDQEKQARRHEPSAEPPHGMPPSEWPAAIIFHQLKCGQAPGVNSRCPSPQVHSARYERPDSRPQGQAGQDSWAERRSLRLAFSRH